jgi:hypothetical protein
MDTCAAFSILPHQSSKPAADQGLVGPNGSAIRCWGESAVKLQLASQHFTWNFLLANVSMAILGISQPDGGSSQLQVGAGRRQ